MDERKAIEEFTKENGSEHSTPDDNRRERVEKDEDRRADEADEETYRKSEDAR